jgi:hypothetical protein
MKLILETSPIIEKQKGSGHHESRALFATAGHPWEKVTRTLGESG